MTAPNESSNKIESKQINAFSSKRLGIKKANTIIFGSMAAAAVVVAVSLVVLNFLWDLRGFNNRVITARSEALTTLEKNVQSVDALENQFIALEQDEINSQVVLDALPSKYDFPALATSIDKQIEEAGVTLRSFGGEDEAATAIEKEIDPIAVEMPFSLTVEGDYESMITLLQNFEKTIRPMVVDSVKLSGTDDNLRAQLQMHTYYQPSVDVTVEKRTIR